MTVEHVSDLTWDRMHAGQLAAAQAERARQHAAGCAGCAARGAALAEDHRRFVAAPPPLRAMRRPRRAWRVIAPALAVAALALVVVRGRDDDDDDTRTKGGFGVTAFAGRDGDAVPLGTGDPIFPGDRLQLSYSAAQAGHLAVLAIDGAGQVSAYFPAGATTWPAAAGNRIALPASTELDEVVGAERLWIAFCDRAQPLAPLIAALEDHGIAAAAPPGCEVQRLRFDKRARAGGTR